MLTALTFVSLSGVASAEGPDGTTPTGAMDALAPLTPAELGTPDGATAAGEDTPAPRNLIRFESDQNVTTKLPAEDLFAMGQRLSLESPVDDNLFAMGQDVYVQGPVAGDLLVMGQTVHIESAVQGDVYGLAQRIVVHEGASIGGDLLAGAAIVEIEGPIGHDLTIGAGEVSLAAKVYGHAKLDVGQLHLQPGGSIAGNLDYEAPEMVEGIDDVVGGTVSFTQAVEPEESGAPEEDEEPAGFISSALSAIGWAVWSYLSKLIVGFSFLLLFGEAAGRVARSLLDQPARAFGLGFVALCVLPVASTVAMITLLPLPLGVLGWLTFGVLLYGAQILAAQALGDQILRSLKPGALGSPYISMAVGLAPIVLLSYLPWIGALSWLAATVAGVGALWIGTRKLSLASPS